MKITSKPLITSSDIPAIHKNALEKILPVVLKFNPISNYPVPRDNLDFVTQMFFLIARGVTRFSCPKESCARPLNKVDQVSLYSRFDNNDSMQIKILCRYCGRLANPFINTHLHRMKVSLPSFWVAQELIERSKGIENVRLETLHTALGISRPCARLLLRKAYSLFFLCGVDAEKMTQENMGIEYEKDTYKIRKFTPLKRLSPR